LGADARGVKTAEYAPRALTGEMRHISGKHRQISNRLEKHASDLMDHGACALNRFFLESHAALHGRFRNPQSILSCVASNSCCAA
jgi:hypothetical protein